MSCSWIQHALFMFFGPQKWNVMFISKTFRAAVLLHFMHNKHRQIWFYYLDNACQIRRGQCFNTKLCPDGSINVVTPTPKRKCWQGSNERGIDCKARVEGRGDKVATGRWIMCDGHAAMNHFTPLPLGQLSTHSEGRTVGRSMLAWWKWKLWLCQIGRKDAESSM